MKKIGPDTPIYDVLQSCPNASEIFESYGLACETCMGASVETIEEGSIMHGVDLQALLDALNANCDSAEDT